MAALADDSDRDELNDYLESPVDPTKDALAWWHARRLQFPRLSRMALDYLSIPGASHSISLWAAADCKPSATSVDVERTFSRGRRLLSHVRSRLSAQTTRAVLCLSDWVRWDLVKSQDIRAVSKLAEVDDNRLDYNMEDGWDRISTLLSEMRS